jgi:Ca-activated chloride channel family protein
MTSSFAPVLRFEFDRSRLPRGGEAFARLIIESPAPAASLPGAPRRGLALAVALDASGSMDHPAGAPDGSPVRFGHQVIFGGPNAHANTKMERCKSAVWEAVSLLGPDDMASLTVFSSMAATPFPLARMTEDNKALFKATLDKVSASGGTALEAGWREAGREAAKGIDHGLLCRAALFTDGEASTGERDPEKLSAMAAQLAELGVGTSCFGVGAHFNEDLLCAMADAGEGNFRYIPDAALAACAAIDEVNGLGATAGRKATLRLSGLEGCLSVEILNAFDLSADGSLRLPALLAGRPIEVVARMKLADAGSSAGVSATIEWSDRDGVRQSAVASHQAPLDTLQASEALAPNAEVSGAAAALMAARHKADMAQSLTRGDLAAASASLESARFLMGSCASYSGAAAEMADLNGLVASLASGDATATRKAAVFQSYARSKNQTVASHTPTPDAQP